MIVWWVMSNWNTCVAKTIFGGKNCFYVDSKLTRKFKQDFSNQQKD